MPLENAVGLLGEMARRFLGLQKKQWEILQTAKIYFDFYLIYKKTDSHKHARLGVNPVPRTYVRGFGALPLAGVQNIHPRAHARGVLWYGVKGGWT
jgi:hypothetical protein